MEASISQPQPLHQVLFPAVSFRRSSPVQQRVRYCFLVSVPRIQVLGLPNVWGRLYVTTYKMDSGASMHHVLERLLQDESTEPSDLPLSLLTAITDDFADARKFAQDGFAVVFKGVLPSGKVVAVKKLSESLHMLDRIFENEFGCVTRAKHKNIIRCVGYCCDTEGRIEKHGEKFVMVNLYNRLFCFEYPSGGKLDAYITDSTHGLGWRKRYKIIKGICEGLHYLHQNHTVHLDLEPANIWLDEKKSPKIHLSGGSRQLEEKQSKVLTQDLVGTPYKRYMAPEIIDGVITLKTDIYSLGVLITQILTGQMELSLLENVLESWSDRLGMSLEDTRLQQVRVCAEICTSCLHLNPEKRPDAGYIIEKLVETEIMFGFTEPYETENVDEFYLNPYKFSSLADVWLDASTSLSFRSVQII